MVSVSRLLLFMLAAVSVTLAACTAPPVTTNTSNATLNSSILLPLGNTTSTPVTPTTPVDTAPVEGDFAARLTYTEGDRIELKTNAASPDKVPVTLEFSKPFSTAGLWQTKVGDAGDYPVTVTARDSRGLTTSQRVLVTVKHANRAPAITGAESITVKEGENIRLRYTAFDPDEGDQVVLSFSGWMKGDSYTTTFTDAGKYNVTVTASDGKLSTKKVVPVTVMNVNRAPVLSVKDTSLEGVELKRIAIEAQANDPDGDDVELSFSKPFDNKGRWTPQYDEDGEFTVTVTATDSQGESAKETVKVVVARANRPPTVMAPGKDDTLTVKENELIDLRKSLTIADEEGDEVVVKYSGWMTSSTYQTTYDDAGTHRVTITATDANGLTTTKELTILVEDVNRPPVFTRIS